MNKKKNKKAIIIAFYYCCLFSSSASFIASFLERFILPWESISVTLTNISSPTDTISSTFSTLLLSNLEIWTNPSLLGNTSTKAPNWAIFVTLPK